MLSKHVIDDIKKGIVKMNVAEILCGIDKNYCGVVGCYLLVLNDNVIAQHGCSNRNFANHDLTEWKLKELEENKVDVVMSNGKVVWSRDGDNSETIKEFYKANSEYEAKNCQW
jgi:hypothetical protein